MIDFTATDFDAVCRSSAVEERLRALDADRQVALAKFWKRLAIGIVLTVASAWSLLSSGWETTGIIVAALFAIGTFIGAIMPLQSVSEGLKHPVLEDLAARAGMEYLPDEFTPPVYGSARKLLFGALSSESFSDLFNGADEEGRGVAIYEAELQRSAGRSTYTVFTGQVYALQRRPGGEAITAIMPDKGIFNFWKPARDMERVRIEGDEAFEKKFEVYSTHPLEAKQLLFDSALRQRLLDLRKNGRLFAYVAPEEALVFAWGKNRFEPGNMFRSRAAEERVRAMFDDLCASLAVLKDLKARLG